MQNVIEMLKNLKGSGHIEISDLTKVCTFKESLGKERRYFVAGMDAKPTKRCSDGDFTKKKYFVVDLDIRKDYKGKYGKLLTDDELYDEIAIVNQRIEESEFNDWSYLVHSGNGVHYYYVGDEMDFSREEYRNGCEYIFSKIYEVVKDYEPDQSCKNLSRLSRLPGSVNSRSKFGIEPIQVEVMIEQPQVSKHFNNLKEYAKKFQIEQEALKKLKNDFIMSDRSSDYDEKFREVNEIPIVEIAQQIRPYEFVRKDSEIIAVRENGKSLGMYIHIPTNTFMASGSKVTSKIRSGKGKFNVHSLIQQEMFGGNYEKMKEYVKSSYGIDIKDKGEIPEKRHYTKIGYEYPGDAFAGFGCVMSGEFVVVVAGANSGKTTFAMSMLEHNGKLGKKGFYVNCEFDITNVPTQRRLDKNGKTKRNLTDLEPLTEKEQDDLNSYVRHYLTKFDYHNASEGVDIDDLVEILKQQHSKGKGLFVIDTLSGITYGNETDRNTIDKKVTHTLMQLCENTGMTIILLHHTNKRGEFSGTQKIKDRARVFIMIEREPSYGGHSVTHFLLTKDKFVDDKEIECTRENGQYILQNSGFY